MDSLAFDILLTVDGNLQYQQNLDKYSLTVVVLKTYNNRYKTLKSFIPTIERMIIEDKAQSSIIEIDLRT